ncbi:MAG: hypothetical protein KAW92_07155 [Candidatus Cloacimonetes bacterium]|nr:hypothetical protein [Candidatus Cloacimonadota bacterium]
MSNIHKKIEEAKKNLPYTFVPITKVNQKLYKSERLNRDDQNLFSGKINCSLYALNYLCVGNVNNLDESTKQTTIYPLKVNGKTLISPYTLKGCISNFIAAYLKIPMTRVGDHKYLFRPNINIYTDFVRNKQDKRFIGCYGIVTGKKNGELEVTRIDCPLKFKMNDNNQYIICKYTTNGFSGKSSKVYDSYYKKNIDYYFFNYPNGCDGMGILVEKFLAKLNEKEREDTTVKPHDVVGFPVNKFNQSINNNNMKFQITKGKIKEYDESIDAVIKYHIPNHQLLDNKSEENGIIKNLTQNKDFKIGDPIFFEYDKKEEKIITFGKHFYYLWAYKNPVLNFNEDVGFLPDEFSFEDDCNRIKLSLLREMFGYSVEKFEIKSSEEKIQQKFSSKSGKVHFNFGTYIKGGDRFNQTLPRPGTPKASAYEFYLKQNYNDESYNPLNTYGDPARIDYTKQSQLSGRKFYRKTLGIKFSIIEDPNANYLVHLKNGLHTSTKDTIEKFPLFKFNIRYENLTEYELKMLLFALTLGNNNVNELESKYNSGKYLCHQIGYGKNYGMGAVKIFVENDSFIIKYNNDIFSKEKIDVVESIKNFNFDNMPELKDSLILQNGSLNYPGSGDTKGWHSKLRTEDFKIRRGRIFSKNRRNK